MQDIEAGAKRSASTQALNELARRYVPVRMYRKLLGSGPLVAVKALQARNLA